VVLLLAVTALGSASAPRGAERHSAGVTWSVQSNPFAIEVLHGGKPLVTDAAGPAGPGSRLSYQLSDGSLHTVTSLVGAQAVPNGTQYRLDTDEAARTATVTVTRTTHGIHVSWRLDPAAGVATVFTAMRSPAPQEHFVGGGVFHTGVDLNGQLVQLKVAYSCARSIVAPFFASSAGYGVYFQTDAVGQMEFRGTHDGMTCDDSNSGHALCKAVAAPDRVQACFKTSSLDYDVFLGTPAQTVAAFRAAAGKMPVPPAAEFGLIKWRDRVSGSAQILQDVAEFRKLGLPLGAVLLDNPWETAGCWGALTFDPNRFPHPASLISRVHRSGTRFMVWVSPWVTATPACRKISGFPDATTFSTPRGWDGIDFTNATARSIFEQKIAALVRMGVDGFKGDRGDEADLEGVTFANGDGIEVHDEYPELFAEAVIAGARSGGEKAPMTMFRAAWTGSVPAGAGVWAGDEQPSFSGMRDAIHSLLSLGASGFALAGSDVGGYGSTTGRDILTPEVFERWTQLGAISPIMEIGGADRAATFWKFGARAVSIARSSILLHYDLFPYLYGLAVASSRTGSPILQPLGLAYPADEQAWAHSLELLVGRDLLAAPVTSSARTASVYLPAGRWIDLYAGRMVDGGRVVRRATPLTEFPLYLRAGQTIPFNLRSVRLWQRAWPLDALTFRGRAGWLAGSSTVKLSHAPRQSEVLFPRTAPPNAVTVNGRSVPRFSSAAALRAAPTGWTWNTAPFLGVLVKVRPHAGRARVSLS
jgi:alpha-D-xyloside xylohydrolase